MATFDSEKIVVWERSNKSGKLCPYSAEISQLLEDSHKNNLATVCLGEVDEALRIYSVNFNEMIQLSETTGTRSPIRRSLYDNLCVLGRGFSWQWHDNHDVWNTYEVDVNNYIDNTFLEGRKSVNLSRKFPGYSYEIVFTKMIQINKISKRKRKIQRLQNSAAYPVAICSEDSVNGEKMDHNDIPLKLTPEFLSREIPGTAALESQVNAYKRNVESAEYGNDKYMDVMPDGAGTSHASKHLKSSADEE